VVSVRFVFEVQLSGPGAEVLIQVVGPIIAALVGGIFLVRAARIQASGHQPPEVPPPSKRSRRRPTKKARSP
jgi:hypothetical protein